MEKSYKTLIRYLGFGKRKNKNEIISFIKRYLERGECNDLQKLSRKKKKLTKDLYKKLEELKSDALNEIYRSDGGVIKNPKDVSPALLIDLVFGSLVKKGLESKITEYFGIEREILMKRYKKGSPIGMNELREVSKKPEIYEFIIENIIEKKN